MQRFIPICALGLAAALAVAGCTKSTSTSTETTTTTTATEAPSSGAMTAATAAGGQMASAGGNGGQVYQTNCSSCHQASGKGLAGSFPPLAGNPVVTGDPKTLIHIVKYGLSGPTKVAGQTYNGMMPAWGSQLSDDATASVLTYIRSSWGNSAGPITGAQVTAVAK